jgi:hypothetical protein
MRECGDEAGSGQVFAESTDFAATEDRKGTRDERGGTKGKRGQWGI